MQTLTRHIQRWSDINGSVRVTQLQSIFDIPPAERSQETWDVTLKLPDSWNIGLIVGPSGSGKTTIAKELWPEQMDQKYAWSDNSAIIDDFPKGMSIKDIVALLSSVGFSSPPSWLRPYHVLSNGEQFRVTIARVLAEMHDLAIVDEFTSVVDRTVAQIGSAAVSKTVRKMNKRLIAVSCHYDIIDWLEPDWIYNTASGEFTVCQDASGRYLRRRPQIHLTIQRVHHSAWKMFSKFHYLDHTVAHSAKCFVAYIEDNPVAFCAVMSFPHKTVPAWRISRLVTLPDYQGVGIGAKFGEVLGSAFINTGKRFQISMSHPALISAYDRSPNWHRYRDPQMSPAIGKTSSINKGIKKTLATNRLTAGFEYVGPVMDKKIALELIDVELKVKKDKGVIYGYSPRSKQTRQRA